MAIFNHKKFIRSVSRAVRGLRYALKEQNFRIQVLFSLIVIFFVLFLGLKVWEAVALVMMIILILVLEIINSIFERVMDILEPRVHPYAKIIKDMMAAAVLIASIGAVFVGIVIFWPYLKGVLDVF